MTRLLFAFSAGLMCALLGFRHAQAAQAHIRRLERWERLLTHLALLLREGALPLTKAIMTAACEAGEPDVLLRNIPLKLEAEPLAAVHDLMSGGQLPPDEEALALRLLARLLEGSRESRVLAAGEYAGIFSGMASALRPKCETDGKLWRQLGMLGGACLTLLLM